MDAGVVVGYLVARLLGGAKRFADKKIDHLLEQLYERVWQRVGAEKALDRLAADPQNQVAQEWARASIEQAADHDPAFGHDLARLQGRLQRAAPDLLVYAPGADTVVGVNSGYLIKGPVTIHHHGAGGAQDWSEAGVGVKALAAAGVLLCIAGLGIFGFTLFSDMPDIGDPDFGEVPAGIPIAAAVFFSGFVLAAIASIAHGLRSRRGPGPYRT